MTLRHTLPVALATLLLPAAMGAEAGPPRECYDVRVSARLVAQVPSDVPDCDDCFVQIWPWFLDLDVTRVIEGAVPAGRLTALAMRHNELKPTSQPVRWSLRRTATGVFNVVRDRHPRRCAGGAAPARPHISPGPGSTYDDLRRAGERRYRTP